MFGQTFIKGGLRMSIVVKLEFYEIQVAALNGVSRCVETFRHKQNWGHGYKKDMIHQFSDSIVGSLAEQGVAKHLGVYFGSHVNTFSKPDLMLGDKKLQVRCQKPKTDRKNFLIIRENAKADEYYILAINKCPEIEIVGWVKAGDVMKDKSFLTDFGFSDRPKVYGVPAEMLRPISELINE